MKKLILLFLILFCTKLHSQSVSIFDIDTSSFPKMKAKIYTIDKSGNQFRPNISDLAISENGNSRKILNVSCPIIKPLKAISSVLTIDVSSSMWSSMIPGKSNIDYAKQAAASWINALPTNSSQCAITKFDVMNDYIHDFSSDKISLISSLGTIDIGNGTDFDAALYNPPAGAIPVAKKGKYKKVIIMLTDGEAFRDPLIADIIKEAQDNKILIYAVILGLECPQSLKEITSKTGGFFVDKIDNADSAAQVYKNIMFNVNNYEACEITWESELSCADDFKNVELTWNGIKSQGYYYYPNNHVAQILCEPNSIAFGQIAKPNFKDTLINLKALQSDFVVTNIKLLYGTSVFTIENQTFPFTIKKDSSKTITVRCTPIDSSMNYAAFQIETNFCSFNFSCHSGFPNERIKNPTLKVKFPNGGEKLVVGSDTLIKWEGVAMSDSCSILLSIDSGLSWRSITSSGINLQHNWKNIPRPESKKCLIKIKQNKAVSDKDSSLILSLDADLETVICLALSSDGSQIVTGGGDSTVKLWDVKTGKLIRTMKDHKGIVMCVDFSSDGTKIVSSGADKIIKTWNASNGILIDNIVGHTAAVTSVKFTQDASIIVSASQDKTIRIWNVLTAFQIQSLTGHKSTVNCIDLTKDEKRIVSGADDNTVRIWNTYSGLLLNTLVGHSDKVYAVAVSPSSRFIASGSNDGTAKIWDFNSGKLLRSIDVKNGGINSLAISDDEMYLVTGSQDNDVKIWDIETGRLIKTLKGHNYSVNGVGFINKSLKMASVSDDKTLKIWNYQEESIQEDISDSLFEIVSPMIASKDIDMKKCLVGKSKDSTIVKFIENTGSFKCRIDSIYFQGTDASAFGVLTGKAKYTIDVNQSHFIELQFTPNRVGIHNAEIVLISQSDTLFQNVIGEGVQATIALINKFIDFGKIYIGDKKDTLQAMTIKNMSSFDLLIDTIRFLLPNDRDFSLINGISTFTLAASDTAKMDIRFEAKKIGKTSSFIEFWYKNKSESEKVQLFAEVINHGPQIQSDLGAIVDLKCINSKIDSLKISNIGDADLILDTAILSGAYFEEFEVVDKISKIKIAPNSFYYLKYKFIPKTSGNKYAELNIKSNSNIDNDLYLQLEGNYLNTSYSIDNKVIDLGVICPESSIDTVFKIQNLSSVYNNFQLKFDAKLSNGQSMIDIAPSNNSQIKFTFNADSKTGAFDETISILDTICAIPDIIHVIGKIENSNLDVKNIELRAKKSNIASQDLEIENKSSHIITITNYSDISPFYFDDLTLPFQIKAGEKISKKINYIVSDKKTLSVPITLISEPCSDTSVASISFKLINSAATIQIDSLEAYPGDIVAIPIYLRNAIDLENSSATYFLVDLKFNSTLLEPIEDTPIGILDNANNMRTITLNLPTKVDTNGILKKFKFKVGLGNDSTSLLSLENLKSDDSDLDVKSISGKFKLLGICRAAGPRLINPNGQVLLSMLRPNPIGDNGEIDIETIEKGNTKISIINLKGETVANLFNGELSPGKRTLMINTKSLNNGTYFVILQTATVTQKVKMEVLK